MGGKIINCHRRERLYTTADAEGMTGDVSRTKRQRKPSSVVQEAKAELGPASTKTAVAKKASVKKGGPKKAKTGGGKAATGLLKSTVHNASRKHALAAGSAKPKASKAKGKIKATEERTPFEDDDEPLTKDLFEKHRKDFERCFTRLEKVDHFGFFFEQPQGELAADERQPPTDVTELKPQVSSHPISPTGSPEDQVDPPVLLPSVVSLVPTSESVPSSPAKVDDPFARPPLTWFDLRARHHADRYVLDRFSKLEKERKKRLGPYVWDRRKKKKQHEIEGDKIIETWEMQGLTSKEPAKQSHGKRCITRNGVRVHPRVLHPKGIDWELFRSDVLAMCDAGMARDPYRGEVKAGTIGHAIKKIKDQLEQIFNGTALKQMNELEFADARHEFTVLLRAQPNREAAFQGEWRKIPFPERTYERLKTDAICAGLSPLDERSASYEKQTELQDSFVGLAYTYNDTGESEGWMKSVFETAKSKDRSTVGLTVEEERAANALATDDGVVRAQVRATMRTLLIGVQDKVLTDRGVLKGNELRSANWDLPVVETGPGMDNAPLSPVAANSDQLVTPAICASGSDVPDLVEQSVWGIDCYTRRNVMICIEKDLDPETAVEFVEKWLLPAINACPAELAHDMVNATIILEGLPLHAGIDDTALQTLPSKASSSDLPAENWSQSLIGKALLHKIKAYGPPWLKAAAYQLRRAIKSLGYDFFRVHPKGHGSIVLSTEVKANTLVTFYRGEVYPSWRWGEKLDAIEMTQQHIGLRPNLPDFYNMALERPQADPRGYGLMIVDASRKAGHGSMLSHSCDPTCEVRVAALNGQLCLAMTTLRDIEQGEELTFDYNAVTESLEEYQAAVCLCGCNKCRGSFLHFSTADCYQQVLNRNSPVAVRFSNLVKGCTKKVMADEDNQTLARHGFGTAAFGAISFSRDKDIIATSKGARLDSIVNVPVWLRTYVADVLRYIEYERRALPVALLCDHFKIDVSVEGTDSLLKTDLIPKSSSKKSRKGEAREKPENSFQHFVRINKETFLASLGDEKSRELKGMEVQHAIRTVGSTIWKTFTDQEKAEWKQRANDDWERERAAALEEAANTSQARKENSLNLSRISFEAADAEGVSAMEQRIQQLTQSLSRIGRVLDHHREKTGIATTSEEAKPVSMIHPPLSIMTDHEVVAWMWSDDTGVVKSLLRSIRREQCAPTLLYESLAEKVKEYRKLNDFVANPKDSGILFLEARRTLTAALLDLRECLNDGVRELAKEFKKKELERGRMKSKARRDEAKGAVKKEVMAVLQSVVDQVVFRCEDPCGSLDHSHVSKSPSTANAKDVPELSASPWLEYYHDRWKLEAAADILLFHARTSTFFKINPYAQVKSTSLEVYARELGNNIPLATIKSVRDDNGLTPSNIILLGEPTGSSSHQAGQDDAARFESTMACSAMAKKKRPEAVCDPDAVLANVTVSYSGEYVFSQLLQWFNGGIGQKQGLPDMIGCVILPSVEATLASSGGSGGKTQKSTHYRSQVRPRLFDWLRDPHQRGTTFPDDLANVFKGPDLKGDGDRLLTLPIGSPILDLLVMGDDANINAVLTALDHDRLQDVRTGASTDTATTRLESTIDEAMPAQAVAKWVQCENESCLKWRRLPFFVDVDVLPEQFFCRDNVWNPEAQHCEAPEDVWDDCDNQLHNDGIEKESDKEMQSQRECDGDVEFQFELKYAIGDRFDVLRTKKTLYCTGEVVDIDVKGATKRVKMHFPKVPEKFDEWIEVPSSRIAPLHSKQVKKDAQKMVSPDAGFTATEAKNAKKLSSATDPSSVAATLLSFRHSTTSSGGEEGANSHGMSRNTKQKASSLRPASEKRLTTTSGGHLECRDPVPKERQQASEAPFEAKPEMNRTSATKNGSFVDAAELGCKPKNERKGGDSFADGCRVHYGLSSGQDDSSSMSARTKMLHVDTFPCPGKSITDAINTKKFTTDSQVEEGASSFSIPRKRKYNDHLPRGDTMPSPGQSKTQKKDSKHSKTERHPGEGTSSVTIPRKQKIVEVSPQAPQASSVINGRIVEFRIPRKTTPLPPVAGQAGERLVPQMSLIAASMSGSDHFDSKSLT